MRHIKIFIRKDVFHYGPQRQKKVQQLEMENEILKKLQPYSPENNR